MIILRDPFTDLDSGSPYYRIEVGVIVRLAPKDLHSKRALFQMACVTFKRSLHYIAQQAGIALAVFE